MNETIKIINQRKSVRVYEEMNIPETIKAEIIKSAKVENILKAPKMWGSIII